jgi:2'-5' RNA ligase
MARLRTFIAVEVDKTIRDRLIALQEKLARSGVDVRWVEPDNLHVTLLFLGEVVDRDLAAICKGAAEGSQRVPAFDMQVEKVGCFPNVRRPRTVWAGIGAGAAELCRLHDEIEGPLLDLGCYRREERAYTPHITLGRVKGDGPTQLLTMALAKEADWQGGQVQVREVHVMSSELTPDGPVYTVLSRAKLGA